MQIKVLRYLSVEHVHGDQVRIIKTGSVEYNTIVRRCFYVYLEIVIVLVSSFQRPIF